MTGKNRAEIYQAYCDGTEIRCRVNRDWEYLRVAVGSRASGGRLTARFALTVRLNQWRVGKGQDRLFEAAMAHRAPTAMPDAIGVFVVELVLMIDSLLYELGLGQYTALPGHQSRQVEWRTGYPFGGYHL